MHNVSNYSSNVSSNSNSNSNSNSTSVFNQNFSELNHLNLYIITMLGDMLHDFLGSRSHTDSKSNIYKALCAQFEAYDYQQEVQFIKNFINKSSKTPTFNELKFRNFLFRALKLQKTEFNHRTLDNIRNNSLFTNSQFLVDVDSPNTMVLKYIVHQDQNNTVIRYKYAQFDA